MSAYQHLLAETQTERDAMLAIPFLQRAQHGKVSHAEYLTFLGQAYHHVRFTVPLMMACGARLPAAMVYRLYGAMFRGIEAACSGGDINRELADALA